MFRYDGTDSVAYIVSTFFRCDIDDGNILIYDIGAIQTWDIFNIIKPEILIYNSLLLDLLKKM